MPSNSLTRWRGERTAALDEIENAHAMVGGNRTLDRGNPNPGNIGQDFNRLGVQFWPAVRARHAHNDRRRQLLQELTDWRNAIAHQDFGPVGGNPTLHLPRVRAWRRAVGALADTFDRTMYDYLVSILGGAPW